MIRKLLACLLPALSLLPLPQARGAAADFYLKNNDRVLFFGDDVTEQRLYTTFVELFVATRFPGLNVSFVDSGWSGERVTGGPGGSVDERINRDILPYKPTVVTIMLGMNDGAYRPFAPPFFDNYKHGYDHIVQRLQRELPGVRLTFLTPSAFDEITRGPVPQASPYNDVLVRYGGYLKELADQSKATFCDANGPLADFLVKAKAKDLNMAGNIIPDHAHPTGAGHFIIAEALLKSWNAPKLVSSVEIDAGAKKLVRAANTDITDLAVNGNISWKQHDHSLPFPLQLQDATMPLVTSCSDVVQALDEAPLKVTGLTAPKYLLLIDDARVSPFTKEELAQGVNTAMINRPGILQALNVRNFVVEHNQIHFARWRQAQVTFEKDTAPSVKAALRQLLDALDAEEADVARQEHAAAQPATHRYELVPQT